MAKILFVMKYPLEDAYSVKDKFNGQMRAVENLGHEVYFVAYDWAYTYLIHRGEKTVIKKILFGNNRHYIHTKAFYDLFDSVCRVLKKEQFDLVYMRQCPLSPEGAFMCRRIAETGAKLVVEIPTFPPEKEKQPSFLRRVYMKYSDFWWQQAERYLSLYSLIGEQARQYHGVPAINIDNGICVDDVPLRTPAQEDGKTHILAVAAMSDWQGYDRLIRGIAALDEEVRKTVVLDLVGAEGDGSLAKWMALSKELSVSQQVVFHGYKKGAQLQPHFDCAALGAGSLGLYRKNFQGASALKLREYCARGLPFVYAGSDPALQGDLPFCMQIPNDDSVVNVTALLDFARRDHDPKLIRDHAREYMSWEVQFKKVFDALQ